MANIQHWLDQIRRAIYGREVRSSIADAIEAINKEQSHLDGAFDQLIINAGNSNAEIVDARVKADGTQFNTLGERLNKNDEDLLNLKNRFDEVDREVIEARTDKDGFDHGRLKTRLDNTDEKLELTTNFLNDIKINVKMFGAKGDGVTDDYDAIMKAVEYCNTNKRTLYFPKGVYLIGNTIDFTGLPLVNNNVDYRYTFMIEGEESGNTIIKAKAGVKNILYYDPADKTRYRKFIIENLSFRSEEKYEDLTVRANCSAIKLLCSPSTELTNIDILGLEEGIHLKYCWFSKLKNIRTNRMTRAIYLDGIGDKDFTSFADQMYLENIVCGGWNSEFGLKISLSKSTKIVNFDSESGHTGLGIVLEGCHGIEVDSGYFENYVDANPIHITGYRNLSTLNYFSSDIILKNIRFYNCRNRPIRLSRGVTNLTVKKCYNEFNYDADDPIKNNATEFIAFQGALDRDFCKYYRNISILENNFIDSSQYSIVFQDGYAPCFKHGQEVYLGGSNIGYYSPTYEKGTILVHSYANPVTKQFVKESGSYGVLNAIEGTTVIGSNIVTVNDATDIYVGSYITIGTLERVKVLSKTNTRIVISRVSNVDQKDVRVSYANPVLVNY